MIRSAPVKIPRAKIRCNIFGKCILKASNSQHTEDVRCQRRIHNIQSLQPLNHSSAAMGVSTQPATAGVH